MEEGATCSNDNQPLRRERMRPRRAQGGRGDDALTSAGTDCCPPPALPLLPDNSFDQGPHWRRCKELVATVPQVAVGWGIRATGGGRWKPMDRELDKRGIFVS
jgi:hypothetical protein